MTQQKKKKKENQEKKETGYKVFLRIVLPCECPRRYHLFKNLRHFVELENNKWRCCQMTEQNKKKKKEEKRKSRKKGNGI